MVISSNDRKYSRYLEKAMFFLYFSIDTLDVPTLHQCCWFSRTSGQFKLCLTLTNHVHDERRIDHLPLLRPLVWVTVLRGHQQTSGERRMRKFTMKGSSGHRVSSVTRLSITARETPRHFPPVTPREYTPPPTDRFYPNNGMWISFSFRANLQFTDIQRLVEQV